MIMGSQTGKVALITGASSGIGLEMAHIHAEAGGDLVVTARRGDLLAELKQELESKYSVCVNTFVCDLSQLGAATTLYNEIKQAGIRVDYLINNAGFGGRGKFHERDWQDDLNMINLNITALTELTRQYLPDFVSRNSGRILNVSSTASLLPGPLQAVYYATKAYVTSFSNAIAEELHDTNITVTALMPGATDTGFAKTSGMDKTTLFNKTAGAREVARAGYEGMLAGKLNVIAGVPLGQRIQMAMIPMAPKKMLLKQIRELQEV